MNKLYLDPDIGCFTTVEATLPEEGVFEGIEGELLKRKIIRNIERMEDVVNDRAKSPIQISGFPLVQSEKFATGKYDNVYWNGFPDEGIRFYFDSTGNNHVTIRPSGTEAKLRFYVQFKIEGLNRQNVWKRRASSEKLVDRIAHDTIETVTSKEF